MKEGWEYKKLDEVCYVEYGTRVVQKKDGGTIYPVYGGGGETFRMDRFNRSDSIVIARFAMSKQCTRFVKGKFFLNDSGLTIRSKVDKIAQDFLNWHIIALNDEIYLLGKGMAQKNLDMPSFRNITLKIPPLSEQQHIVEELDLLSSIIEKKKAQLNELDNLAQSLFYEMFGDPIENAKGWQLTFLQDVCTKINDGTHNSPTNEEVGDYMYVTAKNIKKDGIVLDNITYINKDIHKLIYERCNPEYGDVLYIKDGATTGIATINTLHEEFSLLSSVALLKPKNTIVNQYLKAVLNMPSMYNVIRSGMGGAAITRLTIAKINKIRIPLPPIDLQNQFAERVQTIEHQKELIKQSIKEVETLFNSRMDYYFN